MWVPQLQQALHNQVFSQAALLYPQSQEDFSLPVLQQSVRFALIFKRTLIYAYELIAICLRGGRLPRILPPARQALAPPPHPLLLQEEGLPPTQRRTQPNRQEKQQQFLELRE